MSTSYVKSGKVTIGKGNLKLDKSIGVFNLPAGKQTKETPWLTCQVNCNGCYAMKAQAMYPQVLPCRIRNFEATKQNDFVEVMVKLIKKAKFKKFRWHESGDIYNASYAAKIEAIAKLCPEVKFYLYTKTNFRPEAINLNIVSSYLPDGQVNFGSIDFVKREAKRQNVKVCPVTLKVKNAKCGETCHLCLHEKHMLFVQH